MNLKKLVGFKPGIKCRFCRVVDGKFPTTDIKIGDIVTLTRVYSINNVYGTAWIIEESKMWAPYESEMEPI